MRTKRKNIIAFAMFLLLMSATSFWIYHSFYETVAWSISIFTGTSPYAFTPDTLTHETPILTAADVRDVQASYVADPFMVRENDKWYMFFEVLNASSNQGDIGLASSSDGVDWEYEQIVLDEPFHLSYPYVFKWDNSYYMIPESMEEAAVKLYKAVEFPTKWSFFGNLIVGAYADSSVVYKDGRWWLFALGANDTLVLFYADKLMGPWIEHPESPLVTGDKNVTRPGGRVIDFEGKIVRYVQDGDPVYGNAVRVFKVDIITTTNYKDHEISKSPILSASGRGWNSMGMHHVDPHQLSDGIWIASVDGKRKKVVLDLKSGGHYFLYETKQLAKRVFDLLKESGKFILQKLPRYSISY